MVALPEYKILCPMRSVKDFYKCSSWKIKIYEYLGGYKET